MWTTKFKIYISIGGIETKETIQRDLVDIISERCNIKKTRVQKVLKTLSEVVPDLLAQADRNNEVQVKLLDGITLNCSYQEPYTYKHPSTGEVKTREGKIWAKAHVTRYFNQNLNKKQESH